MTRGVGARAAESAAAAGYTRDQPLIAEILDVHFEQIERKERRPVAAIEQPVKQTPSVVTEAHELALQHRPHGLVAVRDFLAEQNSTS
jgi:hypothetical protein